MARIFALALLLAVAGPAAAAASASVSAAAAGFTAFRTELALLGAALLGVSLLVFPVRFVARLFRG